MKQKSAILIISCVAIIAVILVLALTVHYRLSAIEGNEQNKNETATQITKEIVGNLTGNNARSEASETPEQRASEGK